MPRSIWPRVEKKERKSKLNFIRCNPRYCVFPLRDINSHVNFPRCSGRGSSRRKSKTKSKTNDHDDEEDIPRAPVTGQINLKDTLRSELTFEVIFKVRKSLVCSPSSPRSFNWDFPLFWFPAKWRRSMVSLSGSDDRFEGLKMCYHGFPTDWLTTDWPMNSLSGKFRQKFCPRRR